MEFKKEPVSSKIMAYVFLTIAGIINATGVVLFLVPLKIIDGGFSGTSYLISSFTEKYGLTLSLVLLILNFPVFIFGYKKLGWSFIFRSLFTISVYSGFAALYKIIPGWVEGNANNSSLVTGTDFFLTAVFGGLLSGIGSGLTIRNGGALDGIEVLSVIFAKKIGISVGTFVMIYNLVIYIIAGVLFKAWIIPLYSIVAYFIGLKAVDFIVDGIDMAKGCLIITELPKEMCSALSDEFGRGITVMEAKGYYSKENKAVIYIVINRFQINKLKRIVKNIDNNSFVTISNISDVLSKTVSNDSNPTMVVPK
jgi:uncharacterized membrane-anchored protein YitT (DUF2179 family)